MGAAAGRADRLEDFMSERRLVDITGRLRSPAATPGHWAGCAPPNKGLRFPADPPTVEEIILVMREAGPGRYADRTRGLIAILWRAGLRISEALALTESDLDPKTGSVLVRSGKGGKRRMVGMDDWGWEHVARWSEHRVRLPIGPLFCVLAGRPVAGAGRRQLPAVSFAASPRRPVSGGGSPRTIKADLLDMPTSTSKSSQGGRSSPRDRHNATCSGSRCRVRTGDEPSPAGRHSPGRLLAEPRAKSPGVHDQASRRRDRNAAGDRPAPS
jgi:hypothetical protein